MMYIKSSICSGFEIKNWIEDQFQSSPKLVGICTVLKCIFVPNMEIVTLIGGELWHAQAQNRVNFDGHIDRQTQATTIPKGQNWPRVKTRPWWVKILWKYKCHSHLSQERLSSIYHVTSSWWQSQTGTASFLSPNLSQDNPSPKRHFYMHSSLIHLPLDKMAVILQKIFSDTFCKWKVFYFDQNFTEVCS